MVRLSWHNHNASRNLLHEAYNFNRIVLNRLLFV